MKPSNQHSISANGDDIIKKELFIKNGMIMTAAALVMRSLGMLLRVFLANEAGSEGMGSYQLLLTVYAFFALVAASGMTVTSTRIIGDMLAKDKKNEAVAAAKKLTLFSLLSGTAIGGILFFSADFFSLYFLKSADTSESLRILAVSIPFMAFSAAVRGYFSAKRKILRVTIEQFIEQLTEIGVCVAAFRLFSPQSISDICAAAASGTAAAEIVSFIYSAVIFFEDIHKQHCRHVPAAGLVSLAAPILIPCTANSALRSGLAAVENMLIPPGLTQFGADSSQALSQYGMISGMAMPVIVFPSVFVLPFASLIIPEMSQAHTLGQTSGISRMADKMFSATLRFSIPVMLVLMFFAGDIGMLLYGSKQAGTYIAALAPVVPLMYLDSSVDGMLKGLDRQTDYFICNLIDSMIRVALTYFLLPLTGAAGVIAIIIFSELLNTVMSLSRLMKAARLRIDLVHNVFLPAAAVLIPCLILSPLQLPVHFAAELIIKLLFCSGFYLIILNIDNRFISAKENQTANIK